jgi:hypothetical protein
LTVETSADEILVSEMMDLSGEGFTVLASGDHRPTLKPNGINGHAAIDFGARPEVALASASKHPTYGANPFTWVVVVEVMDKGDGSWNPIISTNEAPWSSLNRDDGYRSVAISHNGVHGGAGPSNRSAHRLPENSMTVVSLQFDGTTAKLYWGKSKKDEWNPLDWTGKQGYVVMGMAMQSLSAFQGLIGEAAAYSTALPEADLFSVVDHLEGKWSGVC